MATRCSRTTRFVLDPRLMVVVSLVVGLLAAGGCSSSPTPDNAATKSPQAGNDANTAKANPAKTTVEKNAEKTAAAGKSGSTSAAALNVPTWAGGPNEPFDVRAFIEKLSLPRGDGARFYLEAFSLINGTAKSVSPAALDTARAGWRSVGQLADVDQLVAGRHSLEKIEQVLEKIKPTIELIDRAQKNERSGFQATTDTGTLLPNAQAARSVARATIIQVYYAVQKENFAAMEAAIRRCLRLSRDLRTQASLVPFLVSFAINGIVADPCWKMALSSQALTAEQCDRLITLFQDHQREEIDVAESLRMDYIETRNTIDALKNGRLTLEEWKKNMAMTQLPKFTLRDLDLDAEQRACDQWWKDLLGQVNMAYGERDLAAVSAKWRRKMKEDGLILLPILIPAYQATLEAAARVEARLNGSLLLIAVRRHHILHKAYPPSALEAIKGTSLTSVPIDPYSNQALKYVLRDGKPLVYSVGKDRKDDEGKLDWKYGVQPGDFLMPLEFLIQARSAGE